MVSFFHSYGTVFELSTGLRLDYSGKKSKQGEGCLRIYIEFSGVSKKQPAEFPGVKATSNFQGRPRKIHVKFPGVLVFGLEICEGCNVHNFTKFPRVELYLT